MLFFLGGVACDASGQGQGHGTGQWVGTQYVQEEEREGERKRE